MEGESPSSGAHHPNNPHESTIHTICCTQKVRALLLSIDGFHWEGILQSGIPRPQRSYQYVLTDADETVAIKVINMNMVKSEVHQSLLASEIECLKSLAGVQNVIQLYEVYTTKNNTYIITEICE